MARTGVFVGREQELTRLRSALGERARLVLAVGDAGIGKTRFVGEGLARAAASGMSVISGGCLPLAEKLPLLPVADALGELTRLEGGAPFEAALEAAPAYVRSEVARLLPKLAAGEPTATESVEGWRYERLFAGVAELLDGVARRSSLVLLIEDVHWADGATLDFLTYMTRAGRDEAVSVVVTCRLDEVPLDAVVADWLTHVRRDASVEEIRVGPLSQAEVAEQVTALVGGPPPVELVDEVYARAEGHPFFAEQLVAAAVTTGSGQVAEPVALPARLAELLLAWGRCGADARAVLNTLALAGRPLAEAMLGEVAGLDSDSVRAAMRELAEARLVATAADGGNRPLACVAGRGGGRPVAAGRACLPPRTPRAIPGDHRGRGAGRGGGRPLGRRRSHGRADGLPVRRARPGGGAERHAVGQAAWSRFKITDPRVVRVGSHCGVVVYQVTAERAGGEAFLGGDEQHLRPAGR
jgi:predicted ATPase